LPVCRANQAFDEAGADFGNFTWGHQEDGGNAVVEVAVDVAHSAFKFVVGLGANATYDVLGLYRSGVIYKELVFKTCNKGVFNV